MASALASLDQGQDAPLVELARHCARVGQPALALRVLGVIGAARPTLLEPLDEDAAFAPLRDDPRFVQLTGRL